MRLVLHIGTEKTGSTTIQDFVYSNRKTLSQQGVALSSILGQPNNRKLVSFFLPENNFGDYFYHRNIKTIEDKRAFFDGFISSLSHEISNQPSNINTLFITSELFHSRLVDPDSIQRLHDYLFSVFSNVTIVCYFREQAQVVKSHYSTSIKSGWTDEFSTFQKRAKVTNPYYNYEIFFDKWAKTFGKQNLVARLFDKKELFLGDIRKDVLHAIDPEMDFDDFDYSIANSNEKLGLLGLELGRQINMIFPRYDEQGKWSKERETLLGILERSPLAQHYALTHESALEIYNSFDPSNQRFSEKYLGISSNPFPAPAPDDSGGKQRVEDLQVPFGETLNFLKDVLELMSRLRTVNNEDMKILGNLVRTLRANEPVEPSATQRAYDVVTRLNSKSHFRSM